MKLVLIRKVCRELLSENLGHHYSEFFFCSANRLRSAALPLQRKKESIMIRCTMKTKQPERTSIQKSYKSITEKGGVANG